MIRVECGCRRKGSGGGGCRGKGSDGGVVERRGVVVGLREKDVNGGESVDSLTYLDKQTTKDTYGFMFLFLFYPSLKLLSFPLTKSNAPKFLWCYADKRCYCWTMSYLLMKLSLRKESREYRKSSSKLARSMRSSKILQCLSMIKELWLVSCLLICLRLNSDTLCFSTKKMILLHRWYWVQCWECPCCYFTSEIPPC